MMQREIELLKICLKEIKKRHHPKGIPGLTRHWDEMLRRWDDASHRPKGILSMNEDDNNNDDNNCKQ